MVAMMEMLKVVQSRGGRDSLFFWRRGRRRDELARRVGSHVMGCLVAMELIFPLG